jgi:hypothetical protein
VGRLEKDNWVAYYQKDWATLLRVSVSMVKEAFGLNWVQAVYAAALVARAEMAAAPVPHNDIPKAEALMRRFYGFIKKTHHQSFDVADVARKEVRWWVVHRELFGQAENQPLIDALADLYAASYGVPRNRVLKAAALRAEAMLYSDQWVNEGKPISSLLLAKEEQALVQSYTALKEAIQE